LGLLLDERTAVPLRSPGFAGELEIQGSVVEGPAVWRFVHLSPEEPG